VKTSPSSTRWTRAPRSVFSRDCHQTSTVRKHCSPRARQKTRRRRIACRSPVGAARPRITDVDCDDDIRLRSSFHVVVLVAAAARLLKSSDDETRSELLRLPLRPSTYDRAAAVAERHGICVLLHVGGPHPGSRTSCPARARRPRSRSTHDVTARGRWLCHAGPRTFHQRAGQELSSPQPTSGQTGKRLGHCSRRVYTATRMGSDSHGC
jgi:hypothetical protein